MNLKKTIAWLNRTYPTRDWNQRCQQLVWNVIHYAAGVPEGEMETYPTATAARLASTIESTDASAAPVGAIHYWKNPAEGHVGVSLGGERVLMTGTPYALGEGGQQAGTNYGITTVSAYTRRMGNPYLGWSRRNGRNASIITDKKPLPAPTPDIVPEEEDEDMPIRYIAHRPKGAAADTEFMIVHPEFGADLKAGDKRADGNVTTFRGYMVSRVKSVGDAWGRTHARAFGNAPVRVGTDEYRAIQAEATRVSVELSGALSQIIGTRG